MLQKDIILAKDDNFLTNDEIEYIENNITKNGNFPWYLTTEATDIDNDNPWFAHVLIHRIKNNQPPNFASDQTMFFENLVKRLAKQNDIEYYMPTRGCINLTVNNNHDRELVTYPHVDQFYKCKNVLIYLDDSDGDTVFFEEEKNSEDCTCKHAKTIIHRESPKKGKAIIFNGNVVHTSEPIKKSKSRIVVVWTFI